MARISFVLKEPYSKRETPIICTISYSGLRVKTSTKQKIKPSAWNKKSKSVKKNWTEYNSIQEELNRIEIIIKSTLTDLKEKYNGLPNEKELKKVLDTKLFKEDTNSLEISFWTHFDDFKKKLENKKNTITGRPISKGTRCSYNQTFNHLKQFEQKTGNTISFLTLSNELYDDLIEYFEQKLNLNSNTIGKHIKNIKSLINNAKLEKGIQLPISYQEKYWRVHKREKTADEIVFLSEEELAELEKLDLTNNLTMDKARDILLLGSWTGLRISDIFRIKKEHIDLESRVIKIRVKKTDRLVITPIHPTTFKILKKHNFEAPKISSQRVNENLKLVCQEIETLKDEITISELKGGELKKVKYQRFDRVTSHTGRRSFASNMYRRKVPIQQIMAVTGHKKEKDFFKYIGVSKEELVEGFSEMFNKWYK